MRRAEEVKANLDKRFPSFLKSMWPTHVSRLLHIPNDFSKPYMPKDDKGMVLEDETGKEYKVKSIAPAGAGKILLSAGWRRFTIDHNLLKGDVVVFHLVRSHKFKVYIVRARRSGQIDDSNLDAHPTDEHEINDEDSPIQNMDHGRHSSFIEFHSFKITVNGTNLDSLFTQDVRKNYYELCLARKSYLHHHLKSNDDMVAVLETTKIANYIKGSKLSTSSDDFTMWDKTLEGFEVLGMEVGFLHAQLKKLVNKYEEARLQRDSVDEEIQNLKSRMHELGQEKRKLDSNIDALKEELENFEFMFEAEANTPWSF